MDPSTSSSLPPHIITKREESSDEGDDSFTVPNVLEAAAAAGNRDEGKQHSSSSGAGGHEEAEPSSAPKSRRAKNPAEREHRRLKRLLRNRVSAQQARERKKVYTCDLEFRANELYDKNSKLEERISTLTNENTMLRKVLMNTRLKQDGNFDNQNNGLGPT